MKPLRRLIVPITVALLCVGCRSALPRRLTVGELTAFRRYGWTAMDLTLRVENRSRRALRLSDACLTLYYAGGERNAWTTRNTVFMTWNLLHLARLLKDAGGIPAYGNDTRQWDLSDPAHPNPEYR